MAACPITDYDGSIQNTLDACANAGGGTVLIPPGTWTTGYLQLGNHTTPHIQRGAEVRFDPDFSLYHPVRTRWDGVECWAMAPLVFGRDLTDVGIEGEGVLNGNGRPWWDEVRRRRAQGRLTPEYPSTGLTVQVSSSKRRFRASITRIIANISKVE